VIVENADQLLDVVIASLMRLQQKFRGETPRAVQLWSPPTDGRRRPHDENYISDYLKGHLEDDLRDRHLIVKREVEIRRGAGGAPGERTDLYVDAFVPGSDGHPTDVISIIVEVKCQFHTGFKTSMKTQLADRYLRDNRCRHGLYLAVWLLCSQWDDEDSRKHQCRHESVLDATQFFEDQAKSLPTSCQVKSFVLDASLL
jgi:hypothetical protein